MTKVPQKLEYRGEQYKFLRSKSNVLLYVKQAAYYYDDWQEDGNILVVQFHPGRTEGNAFEVLHSIRINYHSSQADTDDISKCDRMAKAIYK